MLNTTITFAGNLAEDVKLEYTRQGTPVANLRVIVNRQVKDGDGWKDATPTTWRCKLYGAAAENVAESCTTGTRVIAHGDVRTDRWVDETSGENRYSDVVYIEELGVSLKWATAQVNRATRIQNPEA